MRLTELLEGTERLSRGAATIDKIDITGLTADSRRVEPGYLFAALPGSRADGRTFVVDALQRGAVAVLGPPGIEAVLPSSTAPTAVPVIADDNPRRRLALMAARFFQRQPETVVAVTGTNGKTSVAWFVRQLWSRLGVSAASLGTLGVCAPGLHLRGSLTTPDPVALHEMLSRLAAQGIGHLAMEASSHGLDQYRLDGVRVTAGAFTNLTRDHLDYHGSEAAYLDAKRRLFRELVSDGGGAVVNADDPHGETVAADARARGLRVVTYGSGDAIVRLLGTDPTPAGQRLTIAVEGIERVIDLPLPGDFQAANALAAFALAWVTGSDRDDALAALDSLEAVPGRLQRVASLANSASIYVDYAHTPDALAGVLRALRPTARGRLVVVFGCGGDRDTGKRPQMGAIAATLADQVIVTDDNPRSENPADIRSAIMVAAPGAAEIGDRGEAIHAAVAMLEAGDVLVVAGKGHETGQVIGDRVLPFDDAEVVRAAAQEWNR